MEKTSKVNRDICRPDEYGCEDVVPRGYVSLMDLYENNYMRFKKLVGNIDAISHEAISNIPGCLDMHLRIIDRSKYTTTVRMTYLFPEDVSGEHQLIAEPDLKVRIYHDAQLAEVLAGHLKHGRQRLDHLPTTALKLKWRLNRFLFKWLGYCLYLGHDLGHEIKPKSTLNVIKSKDSNELIK